jgi:transcriptional regulator with XRE-family HTH domain
MTKDEIKQALSARGWTYQTLAEKLRVSEGAIKNALSANGKLTEQLNAHIELLLNNTKEQLIMFKITYPDAEVKSWLPGWEDLTPEQRQAGLEAVLAKTAEQICAEVEATFTEEERAELHRFCSTLRGPTRVFEEPAYGETMEPYA